MYNITNRRKSAMQTVKQAHKASLQLQNKSLNKHIKYYFEILFKLLM